ncbi:hypothetical protein [Sanguibacter antarcticus]|uniref:Uncharacterized protein n=1 Tax=Sanguibacter antarcticus TaxID=372484 RepID=A0A2A9E8L0_9MICO|nr:hypothetical protein [Sanguibacter antarcticus]PFG35214.1 hypothetical protein ATL42_3153 [Sanguibacter antarcticus]
MKTTDGADARDEHLSDAAFERLRAADPGLGAEPDLVGLRAKVAAAVDAQPSGEVAPDPQALPVVDRPAVVDLAAVRRRRSARWFQLAAVSAGVLAVGLAGYAIGDRGGAAVPLAEATVEATPAPGQALGATGSAQERAAGPEGASVAADRMIAPGWGTRTTFDSVGLDDVPTTRHAWAFDPAAVFSDATLARLAAALGVSGDPELSYGSWRAGPADWTAPVVELSSDSQSSFYYSDPALDPWSEDRAAADAPTTEAATTLLTDLMTSLDVDVAGFEIESLDEMQASGTRSVTAHQMLDGERTGVRWDLTATTEGIYSVSGQLAPLVDLGAYDVVGAQTGVARLEDPRFGASGGDVIAYARGGEELLLDDPAASDPAASVEIGPADPDDPAAVPALPVAPQPGAALAWPVTHVTITGASLATSVFYQPDGSAVLVPSYTFTDGSGAQWSTVGIADAELDFSPLG